LEGARFHQFGRFTYWRVETRLQTSQRPLFYINVYVVYTVTSRVKSIESLVSYDFRTRKRRRILEAVESRNLIVNTDEIDRRRRTQRDPAAMLSARNTIMDVED